MKNNKILDRIKKLLAMSNDTSSPNEAAIAAARARSLMDKHQISEVDLSALEEDDFAEGTFDTGQKTANQPISVLAVAVAKLNDCNAMFKTIQGKKVVLFSGMKEDVVCATELLKYLVEQMYRQSKTQAEGRAGRFSYRMGFSSGVAAQVKEEMERRNALKTSDNKSLVVVKRQLVEQRFGKARFKSVVSQFRSAADYQNGYNAGKSANLGRQVGNDNRARIAS